MRILRCVKCKKYTMKEKCTQCGSDTREVLPAKFSPQDRYGKYRRMLKLKRFLESGVL